MYECIVQACKEASSVSVLMASKYFVLFLQPSRTDSCTCTHRVFYPAVWYVIHIQPICIQVCWTWVLMYIVYHKVDSFRQQWRTAALKWSTSLEREKPPPASQPKTAQFEDLISKRGFRSLYVSGKSELLLSPGQPRRRCVSVSYMPLRDFRVSSCKIMTDLTRDLPRFHKYTSV